MVVATLATLAPFSVLADDDISGMYKLVVEQRKIVETGETVPVPNPLGYITYEKNGRMLVLIVRHPRPKPEAIDKMTDQERADLLRTMTAYGETYKFDGKTIEHHGDARRRPAHTHHAAVSVPYRRQDQRQHADV
jgi:hypothetical protein